MATRGHVRDLPAKAGSVKPEDGFAMVHETGRGAARTLGAMAKALRRIPTPWCWRRIPTARARRTRRPRHLHRQGICGRALRRRKRRRVRATKVRHRPSRRRRAGCRSSWRSCASAVVRLRGFVGGPSPVSDSRASTRRRQLAEPMRLVPSARPPRGAAVQGVDRTVPRLGTAQYERIRFKCVWRHRTRRQYGPCTGDIHLGWRWSPWRGCSGHER